MSADRWRLRPGEFTSRHQLQTDFGFSLQTGIGFSSRSQHVALYTAWTAAGAGFGWIDGHYYYLGTIREQMNNVVLRSREEGRALHLFERVGGQRYVDSFVFHSASSVRHPDWRKPGETVELPLFKLVPVAAAVHRPRQVFDAPEESTARIVAIQRHDLIRWEDGEVAQAVSQLTPEARLENRFCTYLFRQGVPFHRWAIPHEDSSNPLLTDVWIPGRQLLIETKSSSRRNEIRLAIGQLADYTRSLPDCRHAILVPARPSNDLIDLAHSQEVGVIWPDDHGAWDVSVTWLLGL